MNFYKLIFKDRIKALELKTYFLLFLLFFILYLLIGGMLSSDMPAHAKHARHLLSGEEQSGFRDLFFWLINILSGFSQNKYLSGLSLCFLISISTIVRYSISFNSINDIIVKSELDDKRRFIIASLFSFSLLLVFSVPIPNIFVNGYYFMGGFPTNVWNNSTTIFLFPFAILLFNLSVSQLNNFSHKKNLLIMTLIVVNVLIKPNYFFVFVVAYPIMLFLKYKFSKKFWLCNLPLLVGVLLLFLQFNNIFSGNFSFIPESSISVDTENSSVAFMPFSFYLEVGEIWELPFTFIFAYLFPILYSILNLSKIKSNKYVLYSFLSVLISIFIYLSFTELGPRRLHGNFQWQIVISSWICFYVFIQLLISDIMNNGWNKINKILISTYGVHVISGIIYLIRYFVTGISY